MGAGYTRWFRAEGNIGFGHSYHAPFYCKLAKYCEPDVIAKPVWPSKKVIFDFGSRKGFDPDLRPCSIQGSGIFMGTAPHEDWIKKYWYSSPRFNRKAIHLMNEEMLNYIRKDAMAITAEDKKDRFLRAGGLFHKLQKTGSPNNWIVKCPVPSVERCKTEPKFIVPYAGHYHLDSEYKSTKNACSNETHNYENILQNAEKNIWMASKGRRLVIKPEVNHDPIIADKHLVNVMRFLVANWKEIREQVIAEHDLNDVYGYIVRYLEDRIKKANNAASLYEAILPCWPALVTETKDRFGVDALMALLDGV